MFCLSDWSKYVNMDQVWSGTVALGWSFIKGTKLLFYCYHLRLTCMCTSPSFYAISTKGNNFNNFLFVSQENEDLSKEAYSLNKNFVLN